MSTSIHHRQFTRAPRALRRRHVKLDNIALVPASLLPYKDQWQEIANELPQGSVLLCIPRRAGRQHAAMVSVARLLQRKGLRVRAVASEGFTQGAFRKEMPPSPC